MIYSRDFPAASYDAWKTRDPAGYDGPTCERCGGWLRRKWGEGWYCPDCDARDEELQKQADGGPTLIDECDAEILAEEGWDQFG